MIFGVLTKAAIYVALMDNLMAIAEIPEIWAFSFNSHISWLFFFFISHTIHILFIFIPFTHDFVEFWESYTK